VHVLVEQLEQFLIEVGGLPSFHHAPPAGAYP
jgi:hypothetical protein